METEMKFMTVTRSRALVEPELLVRFAIKKVSEVKNPDGTEPPAIWIALTLAAAAEDHEFYDRLKDMVSSTANNAEKILKMKDLFLTTLDLFQDGYQSDYPDRESKSIFPDERICREILGYARSQANTMLKSGDYENLAIFRVLMRAGLQFSSWRFAQFDEVFESLKNNPENLIREGLEIIRVATYTPRKES